MALGTQLPIYTTRPNADGDTATWSQNVWLTLTALLVIVANIILWGGIGIYEAVRFIV